MFYIQIINRGGKPEGFPGDKFDFQYDRTALEAAHNKNSHRAKAKAIEIIRSIQQVYYLEHRWFM